MEPSSDRNIPLSAEDLEDLVEQLYPEPGVVDILTLDQFIFRYKFSGLGATAVADMERAQRITRTVGDHRQIGLAEFHIGLIYLHWGQFLGAIKYFDDAQRHWRFAKHDQAVSLAQFAQGVAQHHAFHYETALANYGKVQHTLTKIEVPQNGTAPPTGFLADIKSNLAVCREDVVQKIRTLGQGEPTAFHVPLTDEQDTIASSTENQPTRETAVSDPPATPSSPPHDIASRWPPAPMPISNLPVIVDDDETKPDHDIIGTETAVVPAILGKSPIPQHANQSNYYVWYRVIDRDDLEEFLPNIQSDTALLVDTRTDLYSCSEGDLVIVDQADAEGSIPLKPQLEVERTPINFFLAEVDEQFSFERDVETGEIKFKSDHPAEDAKVKITANQADFPIYAEEIIGIVIGIWSKLHPAQK